jgi:hypothetical protein
MYDEFGNYIGPDLDDQEGSDEVLPLLYLHTIPPSLSSPNGTSKLLINFDRMRMKKRHPDGNKAVMRIAKEWMKMLMKMMVVHD